MEITEQPSKMGFRQPLAPDLDQFCSNVQEALKLALKFTARILQDHHFDKCTKTTTRKHGERSRFLVKIEQKTKQRIQKGKLIKFTYSKINLN